MKLSHKTTHKDYIVDLNTTNEFTIQHLKTNESMWNAERWPEFTSDLEEVGLDDHGTFLVDREELITLKANPAMQNWGVQEFRAGTNAEYSNLKKSFAKGFDLREKPIQVLAEQDPDTGKYALEIIFNGNSTNKILATDYPRLKNALVRIYVKNVHFTWLKLKVVGLNQNAQSNPAGHVQWADIEMVIRAAVENGSLPLPKKATKKQIQKFYTLAKELIVFASAGKINPCGKAPNALMHSLVKDRTGRDTVWSVNNGKVVEDHLASEYNMHSTDYTKFVSCSSIAVKIPSILAKRAEKNETSFELGVSKVPHKDVQTWVVPHFGTPVVGDTMVADFFKAFDTFWQEWLVVEGWWENDYFNSPTKTGRVKFAGVFQPLHELEVSHGWKMGSVVPIDDVIVALEEWKKNTSPIKKSAPSGPDITDYMNTDDLEIILDPIGTEDEVAGAYSVHKMAKNSPLEEETV